MKENTQKDVQQITECIYQKTPEKKCIAISYIEPKLYDMIKVSLFQNVFLVDQNTNEKIWKFLP